ncbi:MAG TPA: hypothetical protein VL503_02675, partial [Candidatus Omnitrophota bacterium]|nr:hypothetical protein [Candidatus Omnitrophota bacterium]
RNGLWTVSPQGEAAGLDVIAFEDAGRTMYTPCWSPDGMRIVVSSNGHNYGQALWVLSNLP